MKPVNFKYLHRLFSNLRIDKALNSPIKLGNLHLLKKYFLLDFQQNPWKLDKQDRFVKPGAYVAGGVGGMNSQ